MTTKPQRADVVVVGAGAAGLMAGIFAARTAPHLRVVLVDGAERLGAKILIAGGGRCNVTHHEVDERAFAGSTRGAIKKVLRRFDVPETVAFFASLGVELKREDTGKLFPTTNRARTVLDALLAAVADAGAEIVHPFRVETIERQGDRFVVSGPAGSIVAGQVVLATGGRSVPQTGSDGQGYLIAGSLGHSITKDVTQALVPLLLPDGHPLTTIRGVSADATVTVVSKAGRGPSFTGALLCTHFGLSGPVVLDVSRHLLAARVDDPDASLDVCWLPGETDASADAWLQDVAGSTPEQKLSERLSRRLGRVLCRVAGVDPDQAGDHLPRSGRRALVRTLVAMPVPVEGPRGWAYAEVTAGGVPLAEIDVKTMASRIVPGVFLCGEICDVDGRIGGFNFQWAWSSGHVAGAAAGAAATR